MQIDMLRRLTILSVFLCHVAWAQETLDFSNLPVMDYSNPQEFIIGGVTVSGVRWIDNQALVSMSGFEIGRRITVPGEDITNVVNMFWNQGLFSNVQILADRIEGNVIFLNIVLQERPRLSRMTIEGVRRGEERELTDKIPLRVGLQVTENALNNINTIITRHFREKGFFNVSTDFIIREDTLLANRVSLRIVIDKGERVRINEIIFTGNEEFNTRRLRRVMKNTKQRRWNLNVFKSKRFVASNFRDDRNNLTEFYSRHGFRDFTIVDDSITFVADNRINLHINVNEGNQYFIRDIAWVGNTRYPTDFLQTVLGFNPGDIYDQVGLMRRLNQDEDAVATLYTDHGFLFSQVMPIEMNIENDSVDIEIRIWEGEQARIDRVIIRGNDKTNEHVIRRELMTRPGDLFSRSNIMMDFRELAMVGHFDPEGISPNVLPNPNNATVDIVWNLTERANDQLELSAGFGGGMFIGRVGVRFNNFAASRMLDPSAWRPVPSGDGQTLGISVQSNGRFYQAYNITFIEPWLGGRRRNQFSISLFHSKMTNRAFYWTAEGSDQFYMASGITVGLGRRLRWPDHFFSLVNDVSYMRYQVNDWQGRGFHNLGFSNGTSNNINTGITLGRNSVNQPIYPSAGSNISLSVNLTPPWSFFNNINYNAAPPSEKFRWIEYHKWVFRSSFFLTLWQATERHRLVLASHYQFGYLGRYNRRAPFSPFEGFDMGGSGMQGYQMYGIEIVPMRGYNDGSLTPFAPGQQFTKANIYTKASIELRFPAIVQPQSTIFGIIFAEAGNAWYDFNTYNPFNLKRSAGVGIRAFLPMFGMLGIDWGYGFDRDHRGGGRRGEFQFILGQQF